MLDLNTIWRQIADHLASSPPHRQGLDAALLHVAEDCYRQGVADEAARVAAAPVAIMDTRDALGICAPSEEDFAAIYALQGRRVRLVLEDSES